MLDQTIKFQKDLTFDGVQGLQRASLLNKSSFLSDTLFYETALKPGFLHFSFFFSKCSESPKFLMNRVKNQIPHFSSPELFCIYLYIHTVYIDIYLYVQ